MNLLLSNKKKTKEFLCKGTLTLDSLETVSIMASKKCRPKVVISLIRKISWQTAFRWFEPEFQTSAHSKWIRINEFFVWLKCKSWRRVHLPLVYLIEWSLKGKPIIAKLQASIGRPSFYTVGNQLFALHHCVENNRKKNFPALFPNLFLWSCVSCTFLIFFCLLLFGALILYCFPGSRVDSNFEFLTGTDTSGGVPW